MNDTDFEQLLKQRMNEAVDARTGPRRTPPPFEVPRAPQPGIRPWLLPLAAAAAVVAVVAGTAVAVHVSADRRPASPAGSTSAGPTEPSSSAPLSPTPSRTSSVSPDPTTATGINLPLALQKVGTVEVAVPEGWVVRDWSQYLGPNEMADNGPRWCLTPATTPAAVNACPVELSEPNSTADQLDSSFPGGALSNPEFCGPGKDAGGATDIERSMFGRRTADHVTFEEDCTDGRKFHQEQYVLPYGPTVILYAPAATPTLSAAMSFVALHSRAPARTSPLPLYYQGSISAITTTASGHRVTIAGTTYPGQDAPGDPQPPSLSVDIDVPVTGSPLAIGRTLAICTDGSTVTVANVFLS